MIEVYLRAIEKRLQEQTEAKQIDHWNQQPGNWEQSNQATPAVFIDFGQLTWENQSNKTKKARAVVTVHCVNKNTRVTTDKANDADGKRLARFDWSAKVLEALDGFTAYDANGNTAIQKMLLVGSAMDTNHDALTDDVLQFDCWLLYYDTWVGKNWEEVLLQAVDTTRHTDIVVQPTLPEQQL